MNNKDIVVWTVSVLDEAGDISQLFCCQDLVVANKFILDKLSTHPEYIGMFITQEVISQEKYMDRQPTNWRENYTGRA
jgi:hypothetical protein